MQILPPRTAPALQRIERRHAPRTTRYPTYRPCLRWEFGFSCAFCLTHEADLKEGSVEGYKLVSIEHHVLQEGGRSPLTHDYGNCFLACGRCNDLRDVPHVDPSGTPRLLEPCSDAWGMHFERVSDRLEPKNRDALHTSITYDLDSDDKRAMRTKREEAILAARGVLERHPDQRAELMRLLDRVSDWDDRRAVTQALETLEDLRQRALADLARFIAIPSGRDIPCMCVSTDACTLPAFLAEQCFEEPEVEGYLA